MSIINFINDNVFKDKLINFISEVCIVDVSLTL